MWNKTKKNKVSDDTIGAVVILGLGILVSVVPQLLMLFAAIIVVWSVTDPYLYGDRI